MATMAAMATVGTDDAACSIPRLKGSVVARSLRRNASSSSCPPGRLCLFSRVIVTADGARAFGRELPRQKIVDLNLDEPGDAKRQRGAH
jgi:hypothetical protein